LKEKIMRFNLRTALSTLTSLMTVAILAGCAGMPSAAPVDCTITELTSSCPAWIRQ
jgi:hypothetical protein